MIYEGQSIAVNEENGIVHLVFDNKNASVNKLDKMTLYELDTAIKAVSDMSKVRGMIMKSTRKDFIVGADITEFLDYFSRDEQELKGWLTEANRIFSAIEDLSFPVVALINGNALGGGFEVCLSAHFRVMEDRSQAGLPEVKLGIFPGFGGTVRLSRLIGADNAIEWICTGKSYKAHEALAEGAVDAVVSHELLETCAIELIEQCEQGKISHGERREQKVSPLKPGAVESMMIFETAKGFVAGKAGPHYPAPVAAVKVMQAHADLPRERALEKETQRFVKIAKTSVAKHLVGLFLNDQALRKKNGQIASDAKKISRAAVVGAGIMGGGIAYQSACSKIPVLMKDIEQKGLDHGMSEAVRLLCKQVERKKITHSEMGQVIAGITPALHYEDFKQVDIVVEAVVEKPEVKQQVLKEVEMATGKETVICSNTSTLSINMLARDMERPENFCGMHFFNPVHRMPLVEVIRGEQTSDSTTARTVSYARTMGKTPVVVNDCPGFFVNRVLFPYFAGFALLVNEQVDFVHMDRVMESFGWPMGPAWLLDVVGLDTARHAEAIMAKGFPDRMASSEKSPVSLLCGHNRLGQKNGSGFYQYQPDKKGRLVKKQDNEAHQLLYGTSPVQSPDETTINNRMMVPMMLEAIRCLEENIIASPSEADMAMIYGLGFPPFKGGIFRYIDELGLRSLISIAEDLSELGPLYEVPGLLRELAEKGTTFYASYQYNDIAIQKFQKGSGK